MEWPWDPVYMLYIIACQAKIKSEIFLEHLKPNWIWWFRNTWSLNMTEFLKLALCNFCWTGHQHQMFQLWRILPIDWLNKRYRQQNLLQKSIDNRKIYRHWIFSTKFVTILSPSRHCNWLINFSWDAIYFPWRSCLRENNINSNSEKKVGRQILWMTRYECGFHSSFSKSIPDFDYSAKMGGFISRGVLLPALFR